ncbi:uncharacterized protein LOC123316992 [Coccinella septempunctata]|uniref:uncharacterized protein LOC123316992 n=1 Tax=Coccinella septempunctata TaxID=41139 RepID=UPI001D09477C|nr:uncharacterized protein LOC123316992 [Coccinella septempunctata]
MRYIIIREFKPHDLPNISDIVRNAYVSNIYNSWLNVVLSEITFQLITLVSAYMFIFMNVPLYYCLLSVPIVFTVLYVVIYGSVLIKSAELINTKKPLQCWVAEVIEPIFSSGTTHDEYRVISEADLNEAIDLKRMRRRMVGTVAVMRHTKRQDWAWLFRLAVDQRFRKKGVALKLTKTVQDWCKKNRFNNLELCFTDCQEGARQVFGKAGFEVCQMYHQRLLTSAFTLQMYQLRYELRSSFE